MTSDPSLVMLALALLVDRAFGELPPRLHPVVCMGRTIALLERRAPPTGAARQLVAGAAVTALVTAGFGGAAWWALAKCRTMPVVGITLGTFLLTSTFAGRALGEAGVAVGEPLARGCLQDARKALRSLCGRDPETLDEPELVAATVESLAENASDSFVAPLFYYVLLGVGGAMAYRAVNTLDAMIGYHGKYEYLGKAAARLDDVANFLPARLTAMLLLAAGVLLGHDARRGWAVWRRDGGMTESPNAGRPMAVMAGLLRVRLEKPGHYALGDADAALTPGTISAAWGVVRLGFGLAALLAAVAIWSVHGRIV
jgi:adenosylcobinamide-phosphate synthase